MKTDLPPWKEDPSNPTRKSGEKRKDKYGNEIKNVAKHLARKAMNSVKEAVFVSSRKKDLTAAKSEDTLVFDDHINCGTPDCCQTCDTADLGEASAFSDARRDLRRDSKGLAPTKRDEDDSESKEDPDEDKTPHLVSQLYKAVSINKAVKFKDGKSHTIAPHHAKKFINQYRSLKPADKEELQSKAHASHAEFKKAISEELVEDNDMPKGLQDRSPRGSARGAMGRAIARKERNLTRARMDRAKKAGAKLKMDPDTGTPDHFTAAQRRKKGLPEETKLDTKGNMKEAAPYQPSAAYQASRNANPYAKQHQDSIDRRNASIKRSRDAVAERQRKKAEELRSGLKTVKEEVEGKVYSVHVKGDSKDHNSPEFKKHLKGWGGELHYASDKGAAYKFKKDYQATGFHHGVKSGFKSLDSEHDGQVKEELGKSNEWGTDALRQKYAAMTPGQEGLAAKKIPTFDARYDDVPTRYIGGIQKEETLSEISARGVIARQDFKAKLQKVLSDPKAIARAKKTIAKKKAAEADVPKNLVHQLHKSQSINAKVKFYDGKEHEIASNHHDKFMNKYHGLKSSIEKESLVNRAHKSHEEFLKAIHEEWADFSQEKPNTDSINPANYPTPPMHNDMLDYNSDDRHDEYDLVAIEDDVTAEIENAEWEDLVDYYDYEDLNYEDSDEDIAEGITPQGRLKKRFNMMRTKGRRNLARNMALKRVATPDRIKSRSVRAARNMVYSRVLRGRDRSSLSASEKTRLEGMVKRMAPMVGRLSIRLQQKERMIDRKRINNRNKRKKK
jgi:hypothetical protein